MKGHTKRNQEKHIDVEDDATEVVEEIGTSQGTNFSFVMKNLTEMNEDSIFSQISSEHMVPESTIKLHCKNMWEEYFEKKSMVGRAQLFVKLFRKREMTLFWSCWVSLIGKAQEVM